MTIEAFPPTTYDTKGERNASPLGIDSRIPDIRLPEYPAWHVTLFDPQVLEAAKLSLPLLVERLSIPIPAATPVEIAELIGETPSRYAFSCKVNEDGTYTYKSPSSRSPRQNDFYSPTNLRSFDGKEYTFDQNGRVIRYDVVAGHGHGYLEGSVIESSRFAYDEMGYVIETSTSTGMKGSFLAGAVDYFDYSFDAQGKKVPAQTRRHFLIAPDRLDYDEPYRETDDNPDLIIDLLDYESFLANNPNGYKWLPKEAIAAVPFEANQLVPVEQYHTEWRTAHNTACSITGSAPTSFEDFQTNIVPPYHGNVVYGLPVNQSTKEGYFYIDLREVCIGLGIPEVTDVTISNFIQNFLKHNDPVYEDRFKMCVNGVEPKLYQSNNGLVHVGLHLQSWDFDSDIWNLEQLYGHDATAIWGPLKKSFRGPDDKHDAGTIASPLITFTKHSPNDPYRPWPARL